MCSRVLFQPQTFPSILSKAHVYIKAEPRMQAKYTRTCFFLTSGLGQGQVKCTELLLHSQKLHLWWHFNVCHVCCLRKWANSAQTISSSEVTSARKTLVEGKKWRTHFLRGKHVTINSISSKLYTFRDFLSIPPVCHTWPKSFHVVAQFVCNKLMWHFCERQCQCCDRLLTQQ